MDIRHADALCLLGDRVHGLLFRADEQNRAAELAQIHRELSGLLEPLRVCWSR